jgi:threonine dehydratase
VEGAVVVSLEETADANRTLVERIRIVAEGAGAAPVAAALSGRAGGGTMCCVVSGGNIDPSRLAAILTQEPGALW